MSGSQFLRYCETSRTFVSSSGGRCGPGLGGDKSVPRYRNIMGEGNMCRVQCAGSGLLQHPRIGVSIEDPVFSRSERCHKNQGWSQSRLVDHS